MLGGTRRCIARMSGAPTRRRLGSGAQLGQASRLAGYLRRYVAAYTQSFTVQHLSLTVVEGFAGGNLYTDESTGDLTHGSPGVILDALRDAARQAQAKRTKTFTSPIATSSSKRIGGPSRF